MTAGVYKGVTTSELDELAAETAASLTATHPDYALVSSLVSCLSSSVCCFQGIQTTLGGTKALQLTDNVDVGQPCVCS